MSEWPPVWILFITYQRTESALRTIDALKRNLNYPALHWHICDDGSGGDHVDRLKDAIGGDVTAHVMARNGPHDFNVGGNINAGMEIARGAGVPITLMNLDDWEMLKPLDLRPMVDVLEAHEQIGLIRLSYYVSGNAGVSTIYQTPRLENEDYLWNRLIREWSMHNQWNRDTYLFSMQPYLSHIRFFDAYGMYPEHLHPGLTEVEMCRLYNDSPLGEDGPQILFPIGKRIVHAWYKHNAPRQQHYAEIAGEIEMPDLKGLTTDGCRLAHRMGFTGDVQTHQGGAFYYQLAARAFDLSACALPHL